LTLSFNFIFISVENRVLKKSMATEYSLEKRSSTGFAISLWNSLNV
jgi:hypothetical protein